MSKFFIKKIVHAKNFQEALAKLDKGEVVEIWKEEDKDPERVMGFTHAIGHHEPTREEPVEEEDEA